MLRRILVLIFAILLSVTLWGCGSNRDSSGSQSVQTPEDVIASASFVGSTQCLSCHGDKASWGHTLHKATLRATGKFSTAQAGTESFYAGTINAGLNLLATGTTDGSGATSTEVYFSHNGTAWSAANAADAGPGLDKFSATVNVDVAENYTLLVTNVAAGVTPTAGVSYPVLLTYGGERNYKQRYVVTGIGASKHISPIQYNDKGLAADPSGALEWVPYHAERWYDLDDSVLSEPANKDAFDGNCAGCHFTGYQLAKNAVTGEERADATDDINGALDFDGDGTLDEINIGCEACHGAGSVHASTQNPAYIVNPANLSVAEGNMVCGQCHIRGKSIDKFMEFAEATETDPAQSPFPAMLDADGRLMKFRPGLDDLADFYSYDSGDGSGAGDFDSQYWGGEPSDGTFVTSKQHHQQYIDILQGPHAPDKPYDATCFSCHDSHDNASPERHQIVTSLEEDGVRIVTNVDNDTLCLACHATHGPFADITPEEVAAMDQNLSFNSITGNVKAVVTAHTQHYFDPLNEDGSGGIDNPDDSGASRCTGCHVPLTAKSALAYDIHSHTFVVIEPAASLSTAPSAGVKNGCNYCHLTASDADLDALQAAYEAKFPVDASGAAIPATNVFFDQWNSSGHAAYESEPFIHWDEDGSISTSCAKCHSKDGFIDFAADGAVDAASKLGTVISCGTCHTNGDNPLLYVDASTRWDDRTPFDALDLVVFPSTLTADLGDSSNICMACHQGRSSKVQVDEQIAGWDGVSELRFLNIHYYAAAATLFGTDVMGGYEYDSNSFVGAQTYAGQNTFPAPHDTLNTCTECHLREGANDHSFIPDITRCNDCHTGATFETLAGSPSANFAAINTLKDELQVVLEAAGVIFVGHYPYFDNLLTAEQLKAAYNWQVADKEPCGYIHNGDYIQQLLYDSIVDMGGTPSIDAPGRTPLDGQALFVANCGNCHTGNGAGTGTVSDLTGRGATAIAKIEGGHQSIILTTVQLQAIGDFLDAP